MQLAVYVKCPDLLSFNLASECGSGQGPRTGVPPATTVPRKRSEKLLHTEVSVNALLFHGVLALSWGSCWDVKGQVSQEGISGPLEPEVGAFGRPLEKLEGSPETSPFQSIVEPFECQPWEILPLAQLRWMVTCLLISTDAALQGWLLGLKGEKRHTDRLLYSRRERTALKKSNVRGDPNTQKVIAVVHLVQFLLVPRGTATT